MIKRIFSKKSGFTLVEIVVAFAVFAIMAAAIMQILNVVSYEKSENAKFIDELAQQEENLAANGKKEFVKQDGEVVLNIKDASQSKIAYDMRAANGDEEGVGNGLVYFVSKDSQSSSPSPSSGGGSSSNKGGEQGQLGSVDARITGTPKFDTIVFDKIEGVKIPETEADPQLKNGVCYFIKMHASAQFMTEDEAKYAMFKLNFFSTETVSETENREDTDSKKTYQREVPLAANIVDAGYINADNFDWAKKVSVVKERNISSGYDKNPFYVTKTSGNTLRISAPYEKADKDKNVTFNNQEFCFYVVFDKDPNLSYASFGYNGKTSGKFEPCPIYKETYNSDGTCKYEKDGDKTSNFIYGAYMYKRKYS